MENKRPAFLKPFLILFGIPLLLEILEFTFDSLVGDGDGTVAKTDGLLTFYQVASLILFSIFLAKYCSDRGWKRTSRAAFTLSAVVVLLLIAEGFARVYFLFSDRDEYTVAGFRRTQPEPYKDATYFCEEFIEESTGPRKWITPEGTSLILPEDATGKYINVRGGLRVTTGQPEGAEHRILVFGGSTVFCGEVPDSFTICSYLQRMFEQEFPGKYAVFNYGVTSVNSRQELERLQQTPVDSNDIVVVYDGVNDIFTTLYENNPDGTIFSHQKKQYDQSWKFRFFYNMYNRFARNSKLVELIFQPYAGKEPSHLKDEQTLTKLTARLRENYLNNLLAISNYCASSRSGFVHFLQPNIYTRGSWSDYETKMMEKQGYPGCDLAFREGNRELSEAVMDMVDHAQISTDLSGVFAMKTPSVYLDFCHVAHEGNRIAAENIFSVLSARLKTADNGIPH